jgi:soluble lytic murein transglycosylase
MRLKIFIGSILLAALLAVAYYIFYEAEPTLGHNGKSVEKPPESQRVTEYSSELDAELADIFLAAELMHAAGQDGMQELERLALGTGVAAYLANLALAERWKNMTTEPERTPDAFYRRALELYASEPVRFKLAAWLKENGRKAEAITEYLLLVPAQEAMEALKKLDVSAVKVSQTLVRGRDWQAAVDYITWVLQEQDLPLPERLELLGVLGESHAQLGQFKEALPHLKAAFQGGCTKRAWWYARSLEAAGKNSAAAKIYEKLGARGANRLGLILQRQGKRKEAARILLTSDEPAAHWQAARILEELGEPRRAIEIYVGLARGKSRFKDDAAYRAYILMQRKGLPGKEAMRRLLMNYPAWAMRLAGEAAWEAAATPAFEKPAFIRVAEALEHKGKEEWASIALAMGQTRAGFAEMLALGNWHLSRGNYLQATRWGIRSLHREKTWQGYLLAYPQPFQELVRAAAVKYELDPHLIWAVMREESHFNPQAVSRVGAMGLMQIMPATGKNIAARKGVKLATNDLFEPEVNINFGAFYLRQLLNMFHCDVDKALAAYNGGSGNVRRWRESPLGTTTEDFPTAITFLETREYISKVLNSFHTYNWLYTDVR